MLMASARGSLSIGTPNAFRQGQSWGRDPFFDQQHGPNTNGAARLRSTEGRAGQARGRGHAGASAASTNSA